MTRKHYIALAAALREARPHAAQYTTTSAVGGNTMYNAIRHDAATLAWGATVSAVADVCAADNPRFSRTRFYDAAGAV